jgi:xanthine dehydrogenase small subunit
MTVVRFLLNGEPVEVDVPGMRRLLDVLREDLGMTGTKEGCGEGECGACTVIVDSGPVVSCLVPVCQVDGHTVRTVEGLARADGSGPIEDEAGRPVLAPLQRAFLELGAAQCGICTPGMLMAAAAYLDDGGGPDEAAIRTAIAGNLCRCTGYTKIVEAIAAAAVERHLGASEVGVPAGGRRKSAPPARRSAEAAATAAEGPVAPTVLAEPPVASPRSLAEAYDLLGDGGTWRPVAGATDLLVELAAGGEPPERVLDLWRLRELRGIALEPRTLVIGALTTYSELQRSSLAVEIVPALVEAASTVGAVQIQHRGTIGGNLATASPAGDMLPILLALDAEVVLGGPRGERVVPMGEFHPEYRRTAREPDELILRVRIPIVPGREVRFRKVGTRKAQAISKVSVALAWRTGPGDDGAEVAWHGVRVALGSVAPVPIRSSAAEAVLEGSAPSAVMAEQAARALADELAPIDDIRSTAAYRRTTAARVLHRLIRDAAGW